MNKWRIEVDVLRVMEVIFLMSHLEISALNAAAFSNTTHHPNGQHNGHDGR
jgi:hypothetical protein